MALRAFRSNPSLGGFGGESSGGPAVEPSSRGRQQRNSLEASPARAAGGNHGGGSQDYSRPRAGGGEERSGDAFAQIVKELVDNAVDACSGGGAAATGPETDVDEQSLVLKRVRVVIQPVDRGRDDGDGGGAACGSDLRISVNDNGCGMENIEGCVEAFRTSKRGDSGGGGMPARLARTQREDDESRNGVQGQNGGNEKRKDVSDVSGEQTLTAGRYGIGLTLCLLHSQRLCPKSVSSITSATAESVHWTRASFVVDTESDRVKCVEKELLPKKRIDESGTMVSLLVPGGEGAHRVWPRLAEYFARFQLSLGAKCSLEVKAPTLSSVPLYIRPPFEIERQRVLRERRRVATSMRRAKPAAADDTAAAASVQDSTEENMVDEGWNDGMLSNDENGVGDGDSSSGGSDEGGEGPTMERSSSDDNGEPLPSTNSNEGEEAAQRHSILRAVSLYLNRPIELKNIAHSVQPIRHYGQSDANGSSSRPMLEVDMIVYGPDDDTCSSRGEDDEADSDNSSNGDEMEHIFVHTGASIPDGAVANLVLIRMVNRIPLLDGTEASGCGLVRGIATKESTWNSFGLDVSPVIETRASVQGQRCGNTECDFSVIPAASVYTPTYSIRDSAQVAPFFRSSTHSLFEHDEDADDDDDHDDICERSVEEGAEFSEDEDNYPREKRKRKAKARLLPAGLRLGNVLIITQIRAEPSALPLPTLSKGRLPMNDAGIDDALEIGLASCLRSLQRTNPELLLTANQLKRTERDARYVPAVSASLASIIKNSSDNGPKRDMIDKILGWEKENSVPGSIPQSVAETKSPQNIGEPDIAESQVLQEEEKVASSQTVVTASDEGSTVIIPSQQKGLLSVAKLSRRIEDKLRFCISDQNKALRKKEEAEKKRNARRKINDEEDEEGSEEDSDRERNDDEASVGLDCLLDCTDEERSNRSSLHQDRKFSQESSVLSEDDWTEQQSLSSNTNPEKESKEGGNEGGEKLDNNVDVFDDDGWW